MRSDGARLRSRLGDDVADTTSASMDEVRVRAEPLWQWSWFLRVNDWRPLRGSTQTKPRVRMSLKFLALQAQEAI
jgi:hypothetical protein